MNHPSTVGLHPFFNFVQIFGTIGPFLHSFRILLIVAEEKSGSDSLDSLHYTILLYMDMQEGRKRVNSWRSI